MGRSYFVEGRAKKVEVDRERVDDDAACSMLCNYTFYTCYSHYTRCTSRQHSHIIYNLAISNPTIMFATRSLGAAAQVARTGLRSRESTSRLFQASRRMTCRSGPIASCSSYSARSYWAASVSSASLESRRDSTRSLVDAQPNGKLQNTSPALPSGAATILGQISAFSTSSKQALRESYFRRPNGRSNSSGSGSGGSGRGGPGWFETLRRRIDRLPPMYVIYGIIGANVGIFLVWQYAQASWVRPPDFDIVGAFRDSDLADNAIWSYTLSSRPDSGILLCIDGCRRTSSCQRPTWPRDECKYFQRSAMHRRSRISTCADRSMPNSHTLLTCCFSHSNTSHIALNMLGLYFIGPATAG